MIEQIAGLAEQPLTARFSCATPTMRRIEIGHAWQGRQRNLSEMAPVDGARMSLTRGGRVRPYEANFCAPATQVSLTLMSAMASGSTL